MALALLPSTSTGTVCLCVLKQQFPGGFVEEGQLLCQLQLNALQDHNLFSTQSALQVRAPGDCCCHYNHLTSPSHPPSPLVPSPSPLATRNVRIYMSSCKKL